MKEPAFDSTPEFQRFTEVMRGVLSVPKKRLDELIAEAKDTSPRRGNKNAPGRKAGTLKRRKRK
jgi:hypothetical protein